MLMKINIFPKKPFDFDLFVKGIADNGSIINERMVVNSQSKTHISNGSVQ